MITIRPCIKLMADGTKQKCNVLKTKRRRCECKAKWRIATGPTGEFRLSTVLFDTCEDHLPLALRRASRRDQWETEHLARITRNKQRKDYTNLIKEHGMKMENLPKKPKGI